MNHTVRRELTLVEEDTKVHKVQIEYLSENKFNVYSDKDELIL